MKTLLIAPTHKQAFFYMEQFGMDTRTCVPMVPDVTKLRGIRGDAYDIIIVNSDTANYTEQFIDELRNVQVMYDVDVTWFGFGDLYE